MGDLKNKRIIQSRNWLDPELAPIPPFDFEFVYPISVYEAIRKDMEDTSPNLSDELTAIYRLIADKQDIIQPGEPGNLMTWSGILGQIGTTKVIKSIATDPVLRSHQKIPTERAIGDLVDTKASLVSLTTHINEIAIHITDIERTKWNGMAPLSSLAAHIGNSVMHVTNEERARWNNKSDISEVDGHITNTNNPHNVTAHQVGTYSRKEVDDMFISLRDSFFNYLNIEWDDRTNTARLVEYKDINWNPNFVLAFKDALPEVADPTVTYFALKPATEYTTNETQDCLIYVKRPGLAWQEVGSNSMSAGDLIIKFPDTAMFVWVQGRYLRLFADSNHDPDDVLDGNIWRPTIDPNGLLTWLLSKEITTPSSVNIKGVDGYTPIKGVDYEDGADGEGVPIGGNTSDILSKLSPDNFDTTWKSLPELLADLALAGTTLPDGIVLWEHIKGRPIKYNELGPNEDGYITQKAASKQFEIVNNQITEINSKVDGPTGLEGLKTDLYDHVGDYNNPHRVTTAIIGAISIATHLDHINNYTNPHLVTKEQVGLGEVDNTSDVNKPISNLTKEALDLIKDKLNSIDTSIAASKYIVNVVWDTPTNKLEFEFKDGTKLDVIIPITDTFSKIHFDPDSKELIIELPDGTQNRIDISELIQIYTGSVGTNVQVVVENDNVIKASIIPGSVGSTEITTSVELRGSPTTSTQVVSDRSSRIATTEFVSNQVLNNLISYETDRPLSANMGRMLNQNKVDMSEVIKIINDLEGINVIDMLDSTSPLSALSANMGRHLDLIKAPRVHTSPSGTTFGRATISLFGHTRAVESDPLMDGTVFRGTDDGRYARGDHRHPRDITRAPMHFPDVELNQYVLTGEPKAVIPPDDSNDERIVNTAWVRRNAVGVTKGTCSTIGTTGVKIVALQSDFVPSVVFLRQAGSTVVVIFDYTDVSTGVVQLNVQGTGAAPVIYGGLPIIPNMISCDHAHMFTFDGTKWRLLNPAGIHPLANDDNSNRMVSSEWVRKNTSGVLWGTSYSVEATTTKVATIRSSFVANFVFTRQIGSTVVIKFAAGDNSPGATLLDVQGTGAATIVYESRPIIPYMIDKDLDHIFTFDGTNWRLLNPSLMGTETFGGNATGPTNLMTEYLGFTVEGHGGTTDANGQCNRALFTIPFKTLKPEGSKITISSNIADWAARMGDSQLVNLTDPLVLFSSRGHGVVQFTLGAYYPSNSPCGLIARRPQASLKIESASSAIPFVPVADIAIPDSINAGSSQNLSSFNVAPVNATNQNIVWSIVNTGGTGAAINTGILTVTASGTLTIRATIVNGLTSTTNFVKDYVITVVAASISITVQPVASTEVTFGAISGALSVNVSTVTGTLSYQWYSNTSNSNVGGTVLAGATNSTLTIPTNLAGGDSYFFCEVQATGGATPTRSNVAKVTVKIKAMGVVISPKPSSLLVFQSVQLLTTIAPTNSSNKTIIWSTSDASVATVTTYGLVNTYKTGSVTITAKIDGVQDVCIINVTGLVPVTGITNIPTLVTVGQSVTLAPALVPVNATNQNIVWSIVSAGGTGAVISGSNTLVTTAAGIFSLRATVDDGENLGVAYVQDYTITSRAAHIPVTSITSLPTSGRAGTNIDLSGAIVNPSTATNKTIVWSINADNGTGATINYNSYIRASAAGTITITARILNGLTLTTDYTQDYSIVILDVLVPISDIGNIPNQTIIAQPVTFAPVIAPTTATNKTIAWSISDDGGTSSTITGGNVLTSVSDGTLTITATVINGIAQGISYVKDFIIEVTSGYNAVQNIVLPSTQSRAKEPLPLETTTIPFNATNKTIVWSVSADNGTASSITNGVLTATNNGTVRIKATIVNGLTQSTNYTQEFDVQITDGLILVTNMTGIPASIFAKFNTPTLDAIITPSSATNQSVEFTVVNAGTTGGVINSMDENIFAPNTGTLVIQGSIYEGAGYGIPYVKQFSIAVIDFIKVLDITNTPTWFRVDKNLQLVGTLSPLNASFNTIIWSISNDGGTNSAISAGGVLTSTNPGTVRIKAKIVNGIEPYTLDLDDPDYNPAHGFDYIEEFDVIILIPFVPISNIASTIPATMRVADVITFAGTVSPVDATNKTIVWNIVSGTGKLNGLQLTATGTGTIKVRATVTNGASDTTGYIQDYDVTVLPTFVSITNITSTIPGSVSAGDVVALAGTVVPLTATNKTITWLIIQDLGTNSILNGDQLTTTNVGSVKVRATVVNGTSDTTNYTQDFTITIISPVIIVTDVSEVLTSGPNNTIVLNGSVVPANADKQTIVWDIKDAGTTGATISGNIITPVTLGDITVTATVIDGLGTGTPYVKQFITKVTNLI